MGRCPTIVSGDIVDPVSFLNARYDEEQKLAENAKDVLSGEWVAEGGEAFDEEVTIRSVEETQIDVVTAGRDGGGGVVDRETADHIAFQDPARTLRRVAAQRAVLARHRAAEEAGADVLYTAGEWAELEALEFVVKALTTEFADHADFNPEWILA